MLDFAARPDAGPEPYWASTGSDALLKRVLIDRAALPAGRPEVG